MTFDLAGYLAETTAVTEIHGHEHVIPCVCDDGKTTAHMWVNVKKLKAICYRCGIKHGDAVGIVAQVGGLSTEDAYARVRKGEVSTTSWRKMQEALTREVDMEPVEEHATISLPPEFEPISSANNLPPYAVGRGIDLATARQYGLGVCHSGFYAGRLVVPAYDAQGALKSFVARLMRDGSQQAPKVLYPKGSKTARLLFNEAQARAYDAIIITEGVFDAIRAGPAAVALFGKHASNIQVQRLMALADHRRLIVMLDDDAGQDAQTLAASLVRIGGCEVWLAKLPEGKHDPGECSREEILAAIMNAVNVGDRRSKLAFSMGLSPTKLPPPQLMG